MHRGVLKSRDMRKRQRIGYDGKLEDYYETLYDYPSGETAGNFSCNAASYEDLEKFNLGFTDLDGISISPTSLPLLSQISVNDIVSQLPPAKSPDSVWRENGEARAVNIGVTEASNQAPGYLSNCSASCDLKKSWLIYIPIWIIDYKYGKKDFRFVYIAEQKELLTKPFAQLHHTLVHEVKPTDSQQIIIDKYRSKDVFLSKLGGIGCAGFACVGLIGCTYLEYKLSNMSHLDSDGYWAHNNDPITFLFEFFIMGIIFLGIVIAARDVYRRKEGINEIEEDIANRKEKMKNEIIESENSLLNDNYAYKRDKGKVFLSTYDNNSNKWDIKCIEENKYKRCIKCGKIIMENHVFCRYCGTPQLFE